MDAPRELQVEATGETVGEAKWHALRELEQRLPGLDRASVRFQVVSEGERGLLGVGYAPARVIAVADAAAAAAPPPEVHTAAASPAAAEAADLVARIAAGIGVSCRVDVTETDAEIRIACSGADLGLLIGRHGQTIDAVQYLANAVARRAAGADAKEVVVDAAGYRERRRSALEALADRAADRALATGERVPLEPMSSVERKAVHTYLAEREGVVTSSEGAEPHRYVVVAPVDEALLRRWVTALAETPGLTAIRDPEEAWRRHVEEALAALPLLERFPGPLVDVGSGGGSPGIPLAAALPEREVTLLEAERRKCDFLERWSAGLPNLRVVWGRAEEQPLESFGVAVAKALAHPPVAAEWCLPLVREGGAAILWIGPSADRAALAAAAARLAAVPEPAPPGLALLRKTGPTPPGFPRRPGMARKRPLA